MFPTNDVIVFRKGRGQAAERADWNLLVFVAFSIPRSVLEVYTWKFSGRIFLEGLSLLSSSLLREGKFFFNIFN